VLGHGVVSNHSSPRNRQPMSLDTEAPLAYVSADPLVYHAALAPWLTVRNRVPATQRWGGARAFVAVEQTRSAGDHQHKGFRRHTGDRVQHAKTVTTRLPKLHKSGELAPPVGLCG
jgi:hypothetical protein